MQTSDIARHYDDVPYASKPFPQSQPQRLAALARLFGLLPPDVSRARVLEIGCAAGGNIIPLAASYPEAEFIGVDLSSVQIASGQARIARMGLKNIRLVTQSIADVTRGLGRFDYIICHGVYSWVPAAVRDAILRVCGENLSEHGIAYVSYNVYPGWKLRGVLRDAMLFHGSTAQTAAEQVALGRDFLDQLSTITNAGTPYGQMLRFEAKQMAAVEDYYVAHEYLEATNEPCYVSDFFKRLDVFNLGFLTEADLHLTIAENFGTETGALLRTLSGNGLERMEQYIDFLTGRTFRQSLLVRKEQINRIQRTLTPASLVGLQLSTRVAPKPETHCVGGSIFRDAAGRTLTTSSAAVCFAVSHLAGMRPATFTVDDLVACSVENGHDGEANATDIRRALFNMVLAGLADVSTEPAGAGKLVEKPKALKLARFDASEGSAWTTNVRHETVMLSAVQRAVLPLLDGTHDHKAMACAVDKLVKSGQLVFQCDGETLVHEDDIAKAIDDHVTSALQTFHASALLAPAA
jgi:methyltransferase-like protein/cyclopropane fatty-acyl-phospholipid synthase-like methyltransferase